MTDLDRCIAEQRACRDYLDGPGEDKSGAWMGLTDWTMEEAILRSENQIPTYDEFLQSKVLTAHDHGFDVDVTRLNPMLFDWQKAIVRWALKKGCAALFEECGLGKTAQQLEWAHQVCLHTGGKVLILTPLAVAHQTAAEAKKFGIEARVVRSQSDVQPGISITNYEMLAHFDPSAFVGVVLDESSILKNFASKSRNTLISKFAETPYRLCCTATPSPNDHMELGNHAEFLGVMPMDEMLMRWFRHDSMDTNAWVLKAHGASDYWMWVCSWAIAIDKPSDLGYSDEGFILPPLDIVTHEVQVDQVGGADGMLFRALDLSATTLHKELKLTAPARADVAAALVKRIDGPVIVWCNSDYEADALMERIPEAVEVRGSMSVGTKEDRLDGFTDGRYRVIVTKPSIAGFGLNWQHCADQVFVGLSYSYEQMYQSLRRSYRFGQTRPVVAHVIHAVTEGNIAAAIEEKRRKHEEMKAQMIQAMRDTQIEEFQHRRNLKMTFDHRIDGGELWTMHNGDCIEVMKTIPADSIHMSVFSPPFSNLYVYSDSVRDMGNCQNHDEFFRNMDYFIPELLRVTQHGRLAAVHCSDLPTFAWKGESIGLYDFPGDLARAFVKHGWVYHSRVTIWKDPVVEMTRTNALGLLYKQLKKDSSRSRVGMPDYLLLFRKGDGAATEPVEHNPEEFPVEQWQQWASPVWMDIQQTDVLNTRLAKSDKDGKHVCPLQLDLIERAIRLWSNPNDLILSPFGGIGSEGVGAMRAGRRYVGIELKSEYFDVACKFLREEERAITSQMGLFSEEPAL